MSGHTPGPWTLTHVEGNNFAIQRFEIRGMLGNSLNVYPIFNRNLGSIDCASVYTSPEDAALISAAPDLLEALETVMQWVKAWDVGFLFDDEWPADEAKINAAIAKARGEA